MTSIQEPLHKTKKDHHWSFFCPARRATAYRIASSVSHSDSRKILLVQIEPVPATIDDDEIAHLVQRDQRMVPDALRVVHALPAARDERANRAFVEIARRRHHDQISLVVQRQERLAAQRMPFEHLHFERQHAGLPAKQVHERAAVFSFDVDFREIVKADRRAEVDWNLLRAIEFDDVAETAERSTRQRFDSELFHVERTKQTQTRYAAVRNDVEAHVRHGAERRQFRFRRNAACPSAASVRRAAPARTSPA